MDLASALRGALGADRVKERAPLARLTTFRIGGPADFLAEVRSADEALAALRLAREAGVPLTWLGGGSNVLVGDGGIRGLVVRWHGGRVETVAPDRVRAEAGVTMNGLVRYTIVHGLAGLADWAGTPGTVGGALHGNAHFQGRLFSETVVSVEVADAGRVGPRDRGRRDGLRLRPEPPAAHGRGRAAGRLPVEPGRARGAARGGARRRSPTASGRSRSPSRAPAASSRTRIRTSVSLPPGGSPPRRARSSTGPA